MNIQGELKKDNCGISDVDARLYCDALKNYTEASKNIQENGTIVIHPRTGEPVENPYVKIQIKYFAILEKMKNVDGDRILKIMIGEAG